MTRSSKKYKITLTQEISVIGPNGHRRMAWTVARRMKAVLAWYDQLSPNTKLIGLRVEEIDG